MMGVSLLALICLIIVSPIVFIIAIVYSVMLALKRGRRHDDIKHSILVSVSLFVLALLPWIMVFIIDKTVPEPTTIEQINKSWELGLPEPEAEVLCAAQGTTFNGDGLYFCVEKYRTDQTLSSIKWEAPEETSSVRRNAQQIINKIQTENDLKEYTMLPENTEAYYKTSDDKSELYLFFDQKTGLLYIIMLIC